MKNVYIWVAQWLTVLLAGILVGGGLVLHAQVAVMEHMRNEVDNTFILWRGIGKLTFMFQDEVTQAALLMHNFPPGFLAEADRGAWTLVVIGSVVALVSTAIPPRTKRVKKKKRAGSRPSPGH